MYAPVGINVYKRKNHLEKTIESLKSNKLANKTDVFIFSDGAKPGDENEVEVLRAYLKTISGFNSITIFERDSNDRIFNGRDGINKLLDFHHTFIFMAEDILTAPGYLSFMNEALCIFEDIPNVISITGFIPPIVIPRTYKFDNIFLRAFSGWGFGSWKDKFDLNQFYVNENDYKEFSQNSNNINKLEQYGKDLKKLSLVTDMDYINSKLDIMVNLYQCKNELYSIFPRYSLVQNIGNDGSGLHSKKTDKYHHEVLWNKTENYLFNTDVKVNKNIRDEYRKFRNHALKYELRKSFRSLKRKYFSRD